MKTATMIAISCCLFFALIALRGCPAVALPIAEDTTVVLPTEEPSTEAPTTEKPSTEAPTTEKPSTEAPTTKTPTTELPTTEEPTTEEPSTEAPTTETPTTETPTTELPTTEEPSTEAPTTELSTTEEPSTESTTNNTSPAEVVKDKLSEQIRKILKHYQGSDPVGFPGAPIPDPLKIPPMKKNFGLADMTFTNMTVHGLSKFKAEHVNMDLKNMQVYVLLKIQRMYVYGNYTLKSWFGRPAAGPFNVTLLDVEAEAAAALEPDKQGNLQGKAIVAPEPDKQSNLQAESIMGGRSDEQGNLQAAEMEMDMRFKDCELDFKNLGFTASLFQGIISSVGSVMFDGIKPFIINEVNTNLRTDVNAQVRAITSKLPKMKAPVPDLAIAESRSYVRRMGLDPYRVAGRYVKEGPLNFTVHELTIAGLSNFRRVGDIGLQVNGPVVQITVHVITGAISGTLRWKYQLGLIRSFERSGVSNFTVDHVQVRAVVNQSLDIRNKPTLDQLDIEVGKTAVQMDRQEPMDYVIEIAVNSLPTLLRHVIVDVLEEPIKMKVQTLLDEVQVEKLVEDRLPELDKLTGER